MNRDGRTAQILLLPLMTVGAFVVLNTVLLCSAGFVGSLLIKSRYRLSAASFAAFFLLFLLELPKGAP